MKINSSIILIVIIGIIAIYLSRKTSPKKTIQECKWWNQRTRILLFILIFIVGIAVRVYQFGDIPNGIFRDEASIGYDTYSMLNYGIDHNGFHNPVILVGLGGGGGQDSIYAYFSMPFVALLGLSSISIRLMNLIFGIITLVIFYLLVRETDDEKAALIAFFLIAINPWHIMISRWGLDCNIFPGLFVLATLVLIYTNKKGLFLLLAMVIYGLALYSYGTSFFVIPTFVSIVTILFLIQKRINLKFFLLGILILVLIATPALLYVIINTFHLDSIQTSWISIPRTTGPVRISAITSLYSNEPFFSSTKRHVTDLVNLLIFQNDGLIQNSVGGFGTIYLFSSPLLLLGLWVVVRDLINKSNPNNKYYPGIIFLIWLISSILLVFVIEININRMNIIFIPLLYLIARAIVFIFEQSRFLGGVIIALYIFWFALFCHNYFIDYPQQVGSAFNESLDQAIDYASLNTTEPIYISRDIDLAYIYVLYNQKIDPNIFLKTVKYENPLKTIRYTASFGRFRMMNISSFPSDGGAFIIDNNHLENVNIEKYQLVEYKYFSVLIPQK